MNHSNRTYNVKFKKDDIEDFFTCIDSESALECSSSHSGDSDPLIVKFKDRKLSVTDFSAQVWCEAKLFKQMTTGFREETAAMRAGIERHAILERADHDVVDIEVSTREDMMGLKMLSTIIMLRDILPTQGKVREVWIAFYNDYTDCVIRGVIDEICLDANSGKLIVKDTKTRRDQSVPCDAQKRSSAIQLQMYLWMLELARTSPGTTDWQEFFRIYKCDPLIPFKCPELSMWQNLATITPIYLKAFQTLPPALNYALVEYDCEGKLFQVDRVPYSRTVLEFAIQDMRSFWWSEKDELEGVALHEKWKCKCCPFIETCRVTPLTGQELKYAIQDQQLKSQLSVDLEQIS